MDIKVKHQKLIYDFSFLCQPDINQASAPTYYKIRLVLKYQYFKLTIENTRRLNIISCIDILAIEYQ